MTNTMRDRLHDLANDAPRGTEVPPNLSARTQRRIMLRLTAIAAIVVSFAAVVAGVVQQVNLAQPADSQPLGIFQNVPGNIIVSRYNATAPHYRATVVAPDSGQRLGSLDLP